MRVEGGLGGERQGGMYLDTTTHNAIQQMYHQQTAQERIALRLTIPLPLLSSPSLSPSLSHDLRRGLSWWWFHLLQLHRHAGCGMMGRDGAMAALSPPSSFCHQTHNEWRPRQLNHHRHNVGYDHDDYDVSPYDHHDLRYTGGVLLLCGWGLWPAAG